MSTSSGEQPQRAEHDGPAERVERPAEDAGQARRVGSSRRTTLALAVVVAPQKLAQVHPSSRVAGGEGSTGELRSPERTPCLGRPSVCKDAPVRVVVVGSGGREACLALVLARHHDVVVTPGNPGIPGSVATPPEELDADLFVIGPEQPLVDGIADRLRAQGKVVFGPGADGAQVEGSKAYMKELVAAAGVPTAEARDVHRRRGRDRLPADAAPALRREDRRAGGRQGRARHPRAGGRRGRRARQAGRRVLRRRRVHGRDRGGDDRARGVGVRDLRRHPGRRPRPRPRTSSGSATTTPAPTPAAWGPTARCRGSSPDFADDVVKRFVQPTLDELRRRGIDYRGVLYTGLMITDEGPEARRVQRALR